MFLQRFLAVLALFLCCMPTAASAQDAASKIDITRLEFLYREQLRNSESGYVQQQITEERARIRELVDEELGDSVAPAIVEDAKNEEELTKAVDRQRTLVTGLQERLAERKADLDLLETEEEQFYLEPESETASGALAFRLTKTHQELLAKKALLEERINGLNAVIELQNERLRQLVYEQRLQQFSVLITIVKYLATIVVILLIERTVRRKFLTRIADIDRRYTVTKFFTAIVYTLTFLWIIGVIFSKQPSILASLAIVGAGLAIALQDVVKDVVGWLMIVQNRLFMRGHRITVGEITGDVVDFSLIRTIVLEVGIPRAMKEAAQVMERTGKLLSIPNATFLTQPLTNHTTTSNFVRAEMRVTVTFESNWRKAQSIAKQTINEIAGTYLEQDQKQTRRRLQMLYIPHRTVGNQVYYDIASDGVELTLRFTVPIGERRPVVSEISDKLLERFHAESDIHLAYATQRILAEIVKGS